MPNPNLKNIYLKKKRRVLGEIIKPGELKNKNTWVTIHESSKPFLVTYESKGLVVSINGSGGLPSDHPQAQEAAKFTSFVLENGGLIINGGRNSGIMEATSQVAKDKCLGVVFPELKKELNKYGTKVLVNAPGPRIELLGTCTPIIVIFRGGLGTLMVLMRAIVHLRNRQYHPEQLPQLVFVSSWWIGLLTTMKNMGCLPAEFLSELNFFGNAEQIIEKIPK